MSRVESRSAASVAASLESVSTTPKSARVSPAAYLMQALGRMTPEGCAPRSVMALESRDLFHQCTQMQMEYYDRDAIEAIHNRDIETLRVWHAKGRPLQTSSPFGDTLLHIACRRGYLDVVTFLVKEASVSLWVQDEQGRTPLHVGCHSSEPWFDLVDFIVQQDPDLLFVADARGSMPLDYAPRESWADWIAFLNKKELRSVMPRRQVFFTSADRRSIPHNAVPCLEDIDRIITDYIVQTKKKRTSNRRCDATASSEDETSGQRIVRIDSTILENLRACDEGSFSSHERLEVLHGFTSSPSEVLIANTCKEANTGLPCEHELKVQTRVTSGSSLASSSTEFTTVSHENDLLSAMSNYDGERIHLLKLLKELSIRHINALTAVEIAREMDQARDFQAGVNAASEECDQLAKEIREVQKKLGQSTFASYGKSQSDEIALCGLRVGRRNDSEEEPRSVANGSRTERVEPRLAADSLACFFARDQAAVVSDSVGETHSTDDDDTIDACLCERLLSRFETDESLVAKYVSCHCGGSGNYDCYLQLHLPEPLPGSAPGKPGVIVGSIRKSSISDPCPVLPTRKMSVSGARRLFRFPMRDEHQCD